jgi:creatinine amidohydrolase/Fe(II)-dependent formamide hydrolase-like protein
MADAPRGRLLGNLFYPDIAQRLRRTSILCLPLGAIEQHGAHLPLDTDLVVAEGLTRRIVARWGEEFDLWQLPSVPIGLSREHDWAAGTLSLSVESFAALLRDIASAIVRGLPARNLVIINGHGGNRGILEPLLHELGGDFEVNACAIHPFDLARVESTAEQPDVHGGKSETSVMLALAPERVRMARLPPAQGADSRAVHDLILDRGVTWPWRTDNPSLADRGIIGDPHSASAELGEAIIERVVEEFGRIFRRLLENRQRFGL